MQTKKCIDICVDVNKLFEKQKINICVNVNRVWLKYIWFKQLCCFKIINLDYTKNKNLQTTMRWDGEYII